MEKLKSNLILFTSSFPFGKAEQFIETEIHYLSKEFDYITIIPYNYGGCKIARKVPSNSYVINPLKPEGFSSLKLFYKGFFNLIPIRIFIKELFAKKFYYFNLRHLVYWFRYTLVIRMLASDKTLNSIINNPKYSAVIYFYWGKIHSALIPFIDRKIPRVVKLHGSDLYEEKDIIIGSIPFRRAMLENLDTAILISCNGKEYLRNKYNDIEFAAKIFRLGVKFNGTAKGSQDNCLRIVSCSSFSKLKRVHLIAEALNKLDFPVIWTHIGDGLEKESINKIILSFPKNVSVVFLGQISNSEVSNFYNTNPVDLFINVSEYEGVPVSIMEALSFSIPVFGSNVGGIPELIDNSIGRLLPVDITSTQLAIMISDFYKLTPDEKNALRELSYKRWNELANADKNYYELSKFLKSYIK